jgi:glycosyltransferase involved in cell wall biosynthesis
MTEISIAVPVYNGESMLRDALECLRRQTFRDFEVLILDNASTDGTRAIAQDFVDADPRFRLLVQPFNKGAMGNFIDGFDQARARYYLWRAFDDVTDDNYLEELHQLLVTGPGAGLATGITRTLYLDGSKLRVFVPPKLSGIELLDILTLMFRSHAGWFYGVWDRAALRPVWDEMLRVFPHPWASDHLILFPFLLDRAVALTDKTTFIKYIKRTADMPRDRTRPKVAEMLAFRRDFSRWCGGIIDARYAQRPMMRFALRVALWFYTGKRVYRFRMRRWLVEKLRGAD